jgi:tRNA-Thr(GGU) m(6)t(6)A37 methyltransferase TsaA
MVQLIFIGKVASPLKRLEDCPRQEHESAPPATLEISEDFIEGMKDINSGDRLIVLTWLHESDRKVMTTRPRNDLTAPITGVFSTRSPDRPNPLGMHSVKVLSVYGNKIEVSSLEVLDQTPIIDIKPDLAKDQ